MAHADESHDETIGQSPQGLTGADLRQTLTNFYNAKNPEKVKDLDTILVRFEGKHDRLVRELEKKYQVRLADFTGPVAGEESSASEFEQTPSPAAIGAVSTPAVASAALRKELSQCKALYGATRAEKAKADAALSLMRREKVDVEAQLREQRKWNEKLRERLKDAEAREAVNAQRSQSLELQTKGLQEGLSSARKEVAVARNDADSRQKQLFHSLSLQHELQTQLSVMLSPLGRRSNPYQDEAADNQPDEVQAGDTVNREQGSLSLEAARAEIALLLRSKAEAERRMRDKARLVDDLTDVVSDLRGQLARKGGSVEEFKAIVEAREHEVAQLRSSLAECKEKLAASQKAHGTNEVELERARDTLKVAAGTRREIQAHFQREREAIEKAARQRVAEAHERSSLQQMDVLSQDSELFRMQEKVGEQDRALMKLEIDELSRSVISLVNEKKALDEDTKHLRTELRRVCRT
jgi:chromosome segregation ATPase